VTFPATTFLNVDLDLTSPQDLAPLANALHARLCALHVGRRGRTYWARLELNREAGTADLAIRRLVAAIQALPRADRSHWKRTSRRDFNIGIQAADMPQSTEFPIGADTVAMVGRLGGRIVFTVYGSSLSA
jgi:hypothetical protein